MLKEIGQYIANHSSFVLGATLQVGFRPATAPDRCIVLRCPTGGTGDFYLRDRVDFHLQVIARSADFHEADRDAWAVYALLHGATAIDLPIINSGTAYHIATAEAQQLPSSIGQDERSRHEVSVNFVLRIQTK